MTEYHLLGGADWPALLHVVLGGEAAPTGLPRLILAPPQAERMAAWVTVEGITPRLAEGALTVEMPNRSEDLTRALAEDVFRLWPDVSAEALARRRGAMLVRAQARLNAAMDDAPTTLRHRAGGADLTVHATRQTHGGFFAMEEYQLSHRRFDGAMSPVLSRSGFISGDAVVVLPFDPVRDQVLLVEQFRTGPCARGDTQPWSLEAVAGRIDPGESPEGAARREAEEEAGLRLRDLIPLGGYYPSPGAVSEYLYNFIALTDLPDDLPRFGGVADEAEDLRLHLVSFDHLIRLIETGEVNNGPLILAALRLAARRATLRPEPC